MHVLRIPAAGTYVLEHYLGASFLLADWLVIFNIIVTKEVQFNC